jgi:hypothetical protein
MSLMRDKDVTAELLDDLFIGAVKQLSRHSPVRLMTIGQELARQLSADEPPSPSGTPYWYTVCGCKGWKLQRQIVRDPLDSCKRRGTGFCRVLDWEDRPHAFGQEEDLVFALQTLMAPPPAKQRKRVSDRAAVAGHGTVAPIFLQEERHYGRALGSADIDQSMKFSKVESWLATQPLIEGYDLIGVTPGGL